MAYYFFVDVANLNNQLVDGFGPADNVLVNNVDHENFLLGSKHKSSTDVNAIAICNGQIFVQQQSQNPDLLNIIFKPNEIQPFNFPCIKYFIYRGIRKDSLVAGDGLGVAAKGTNSLIDSIWKAYDKFNNEGSPSKSILGLHADLDKLSNETLIDDVFLSKINGLQFWKVNAGDVIGKFEKDSISFEIVLDSIFFRPDLAFAKNIEASCKVKVLGTNHTHQEFFEYWHDKETILNFIDPCAFFGSFYHEKLLVVNNTNTQKWKDADLFENLLVKFLNKNKCYIDIRNEFNFSLNYFKNYSNNPNLNNVDIHIKLGDNSFSNRNYYENSWPILIVENSEFNSNSSGFQGINIQLPTGKGDNPKPLIYFDKAYNISKNVLVEYQKQEKFKSLTIENDYTNTFNFAVPYINNNLICTYTLLKYAKRESEELLPEPVSTQIRKADYLDALFPVAINFNYGSSILKTKAFDIELYLDVLNTHNYEGIFSLAISSDQDNITLFANPTLVNTNEIKRQPLSITNTFNSSNDLNVFEELDKIELSSNFVKATLNISNNSQDIIQFSTAMADVEGKFDIPDLRNIIGINITKAQWESLVLLADTNFIQKYPVYLSVIDKEHLEDDDGKNYTSLNLALKGYQLQNDSMIINVLPANINLITYGIV